MYLIKKEIYIFFLILLTAWMNETLAVLDFCLGIALYYLLFRIIIIYFSRSAVTQNRLQWILNCYHLFLLIHSLIFILLLINIDFDFFMQPGDWYQYHHDGNSFSNYLKGSAVFSPLVGDAIAYSSLIGLIYYFFSSSVLLAVTINVFFVVTSSIMLYLLVKKLFGHPVAKYALYLAMLYPILFIYEINLWKECFVFFLMTLGSLVTYRALSNNRKSDMIITILLYITLYNVRFYLILPLILYILYHYTFVNRRLINIFLIIITITGVLSFMKDDVRIINESTFIDYAFVSGISLIDRTNQSFNYQVTGLNPFDFLKIITNNWSYYAKRIPLFYSNVWTLQRVYYFPFLSEKSTINEELWVYNVLSYMNSLFVWVFMFVSLWGFKKFFVDLRKHTAVLWIPIIIIPLLVAIFSNNQRYMFVLIYSTIPCIAYGVTYCKRYKDYIVIAGLLIITLITLVNKDTFIFYPISMGLILFSGYMLYLRVFKKYFLLSQA